MIIEYKWAAYIAGLAPASSPAQICNEPAVFITSCLLIIITAFFDILLNISPTPIDLYPGFLFQVSPCMLLNFPKMHSYWYLIYLPYITLWRVLQLVFGDPMLLFQNIIKLQPFTTHLYLVLMIPNLLVFLLLLFLLVLRQVLNAQLDAFFVLVLVVTFVGRCLFHQDDFNSD